MIMFLFIASYMVVALLFCIFDAAIGFGIEFDGYQAPPLGLVALFWPLAIPIMMLIAFIIFLEKIKKKRINKENDELLRLQEDEKIMREIG